MEQKLNKYKFEGIRYIPSYGDTDYDDVEIEAISEEEAWKQLTGTWKGVDLTEVNGIKK